MSHHPDTPALRRLVQGLWSERRLLELLLFKLVTARLILAADARRFIAPAVSEVEGILEKIREVELARSVAVDRVAEDWHMPSHALSLRYLAEHSPEPVGSMFADHRRSFLALTAEIQEAANDNRGIASSALDHVRDSISVLTGAEPSPTYSPAGRRDRVDVPAQRFDGVV